jgi:hypothetical protein
MSDDIFRRQEAELFELGGQRVKKFIRLLEEARIQLKNELNDINSLTPSRFETLSSQLDQIEADLLRNFNRVGLADGPLSELVKKHLSESLPLIDVKASISFDRVDSRILADIADSFLGNIKNVTADQVEIIRKNLFASIGVKGEGVRDVAKRLASPGGEFAGQYWRVENIVRTETSTIYNARHLQGIREASERAGVVINKKIVETIDDSRNHPISQILNGMIKPPEEPFRVPVAAVAKVAKRLKRSAGGVLWPVADGHYVGQNLPAHYRERGVVTPTRDKPVNKGR